MKRPFDITLILRVFAEDLGEAFELADAITKTASDKHDTRRMSPPYVAPVEAPPKPVPTADDD